MFYTKSDNFTARPEIVAIVIRLKNSQASWHTDICRSEVLPSK